MPGDRVVTGVAVAITACVCMFFPAEAARAEEAPYIFDPVLSLTGNCEVSTVDMVPDPGCPEDIPPESFVEPRSVVTDTYGNILVPNSSVGGGIDVFDAEGYFQTQLTEGLEKIALEDIAIDEDGYVYVYGFGSQAKVLRLDPGPENDPANGNLDYESPVKVLDESSEFQMSIQNNSIAVDAAGRLYVDMRNHISIYGSVGEGNGPIDLTIGEGLLERSKWVAVDSRNGDIYASNRPLNESASSIKVFSKASNYLLKRTISNFSNEPISPAIDENTGRVFVGDLEGRKKVYVFEESSGDQEVDEDAPYIQHSFDLSYMARITVDNGENSPNQGYLFVPSEGKPDDHLFAFEPLPPPEPPDVESVGASNVTDTEATLIAVIKSGNPEAEYRLEYVSQEAFEESGFAEAVVAGEGKIPAGSQGVTVSATATGLAPGITYHVRAFAENECEPGGCSNEGEATFTTHSPILLGPCPNDELRAGSSANLPDCRAYELVTPPNTGGRPPQTVGNSSGDLFGTLSATADGTSVSFVVGSGGIPGTGAAGGFFGDGYLAERSPTGWSTRLDGPSGAQIGNPQAGGLSPDHDFAAWATGTIDTGELYVEGGARYIRYPSGSFQLVARGSLGDGPRGRVRRITEAGGHIIFESSVQLEPQVPPGAIYDRTIDPITGEEITHVVSLLPGNETPATSATYQGSSSDGTAIAFKLGNAATSLYVRINNSETLVAAEEPGAEFAGLSQDGRYLFYELEGDLFRFDAETEETDPIVESGDALMVNVPAEGTGAYFASQSVLTGEKENSEGDKALAGEWNHYVWDGEGINFIATVTERDVAGEFHEGSLWLDGLRLWALNPTGGARPITTEETAKNPSRTTPDGAAILFESRANLTGYESDGKAEIYRYDAIAGELSCLSCNPTGSTATGDALLQSVGFTAVDSPTKTFALVPNLRADGKRAFFESPDPLVLGDTNKTQDVYEWEEEGVGSCEKPGGCVYLISSGHSSRRSYLYGASASGDDVFFTTTDLLVGADQDATPSIYDARVEGGFAEPSQEACEGEGCLPQPTSPPSLDSAGTRPTGESPPVKKTVKCPKGKRKIKRNGKVRCVKRHHKHKRPRSGGRR